MIWPALNQHFSPAHPKRILSLDGGGVRGILSLAYLERLEGLLRARYGNDPDFRLCHYFDLIGGTSTGAIIAAGLGLGFTVEKLQKIYEELAASVFRRNWHRFGIFDSKFPAAPLKAALEAQFGNICLGGPEIRTGLMIMTKRLDTGSPWVIHNHPDSRYFDPKPPSTAYPNKLYSLRQVVRASTAAPHYFEPERIQVADGVAGAFIDGGVSPHNNPALQLFMLATMKGYGWNWQTGADQLLLVSVGTGDAEPRLETDEVMEYPAAELARRALLSMMDDCSVLTQTVLQWMARCSHRWSIDREIGDLRDDHLGGQELLTYLRYNVTFESAWIARHLGTVIDATLLRGLSAMDKPRNLKDLARIGSIAAEKQIKNEHFPPEFDIVELQSQETFSRTSDHKV